MHRFYCEKAMDGYGFLAPEDVSHALKVLRLKPGDRVEAVCDGQRRSAEIADEGRLLLHELLPSTEPALKITLFQGLPKADKMDWIVQKAVEIGVFRIVPVLMERCVTRLSPQDAEKKRARWARIAREAGKQSGRCLVPEVCPPVALSGISFWSGGLEACAVPWEEERAKGPLAFVNSHPGLRSLGILIGPEGGISASEIESLPPSFQAITLGPRILRTETAGLSAASAFLALYGEMEGIL